MSITFMIGLHYNTFMIGFTVLTIFLKKMSFSQKLFADKKYLDTCFSPFLLSFPRGRGILFQVGVVC